MREWKLFAVCHNSWLTTCTHNCELHKQNKDKESPVWSLIVWWFLHYVRLTKNMSSSHNNSLFSYTSYSHLLNTPEALYNTHYDTQKSIICYHLASQTSQITDINKVFRDVNATESTQVKVYNTPLIHWFMISIADKPTTRPPPYPKYMQHIHSSAKEILHNHQFYWGVHVIKGNLWLSNQKFKQKHGWLQSYVVTILSMHQQAHHMPSDRIKLKRVFTLN